VALLENEKWNWTMTQPSYYDKRGDKFRPIYKQIMFSSLKKCYSRRRNAFFASFEAMLPTVERPLWSSDIRSLSPQSTGVQFNTDL
jgi:hypothetical protein